MTPNDVLRLSRRLGVHPAEFLERCTVPAVHERTLEMRQEVLPSAIATARSQAGLPDNIAKGGD